MARHPSDDYPADPPPAVLFNTNPGAAADHLSR